MNNARNLHFLICALLIVTLTSCSQPTPLATLPPPTVPHPPTDTAIPTAVPTVTPVPPTLTPTSIPKSPTATRQMISDPAELVGIVWHGVGQSQGKYHLFYPDGTFKVSEVRDVLENNPNVVCTWRFEGTQLIVCEKEISLRNLPSCGELVGIYEVEKLSYKQIRFHLVKDFCGPRAKTMNQIHERVK